MEKTLTNTTASQAKDNVKLLINYSIYFRVSLRVAYNVLRLCVCLPLAQCFNLTTNFIGQIAQNRCYTLARLIKRET